MPRGLGGIKTNDKNLAAIERTYAHATAIDLVAEALEAREPTAANAIRQLSTNIIDDSEALMAFFATTADPMEAEKY